MFCPFCLIRVHVQIGSMNAMSRRTLRLPFEKEPHLDETMLRAWAQSRCRLKTAALPLCEYASRLLEKQARGFHTVSHPCSLPQEDTSALSFASA